MGELDDEAEAPPKRRFIVRLPGATISILTGAGPFGYAEAVAEIGISSGI
jgi:hypothetical protein